MTNLSFWPIQLPKGYCHTLSRTRIVVYLKIIQIENYF